MSQVRAVANTALEQLLVDAKRAPRKRLHLNVHQTYEENPQILYNCLTQGSYMRPHRHTQDGRREFFVCLTGEALIVTFTDVGMVDGIFLMAADGTQKVRSVSIEPSLWHSIVCVSEQSLLLEVKPGPFEPNLAKEFSPWSPEEGDPLGMAFLTRAIARYVAAHRNAAQLPVEFQVK